MSLVLTFADLPRAVLLLLHDRITVLIEGFEHPLTEITSS